MFAWLCVLLMVLGLSYAVLLVFQAQKVKDKLQAEFWEAAEEAGVELEYGANSWPTEDIAAYKELRDKIIEKYKRPKSLTIGGIAFRKERMCKIVSFDMNTTPPCVTVVMADDKSEVGTEIEMLTTPVQMALEHQLPGGKREDGTVMALPWQRVIPESERKVLKEALVARATKTVPVMCSLQNDKPGFQRLWQQKRISDRYWASVLECEKALEAEIREAQRDAEDLEPGFGRQVIQQALGKKKEVDAKDLENQKRDNIKAALDAKKKEIALAKFNAEQDIIDAKKAEIQRAEDMAKQLIEEESKAAKKKPAKKKKV